MRCQRTESPISYKWGYFHWVIGWQFVCIMIATMEYCDCVSLVVVKIGQVDNMYIGDYWTLDWYDMTKMSFGTAGRAVNWEIEIDSYRDE